MLYFTLDDREYEFDQNRLALSEAIAVKRANGLTVRGLQEGLQDMDPDALQAMVWLAKRRAGDAVRMVDIEFDIVELSRSIRYDEPPGEQADPTVGQPIPDGSPSGMTPSSVEPGISVTSPITSA